MNHYVLTAAVLLGLAQLQLPLLANDTVSFSKQLAGILVSKCAGCHGAKLAEGDYRVDTFARLLQPAASGERPIVPGKPDESELLVRLLSDDEDIRMPAESDPLGPETIDLFRRWIEQGAQFNGSSVSSPLSELRPQVTHPEPPETYPAPLAISALAIAPDGQSMLIGGYHELNVWSMQGELLRRIKNQGQRTYSIDQHPSEPIVLSASGTPGEIGEVRLFDLDSGDLIKVLARSDEVILDARYSPDGKQIAIAMPDGSTRILDGQSHIHQATLLGHSDRVTAVRWHRDNQFLATGSADKTAKVFDVKKQRSTATFAGHTGAVTGLIFSGNDQAISVSDDGTAQQWSTKDGRKQKQITQSNQPLLSIASMGDKFVVTGAMMSQVLRLDNHQSTVQFQSDGDWLTASAMRADDRVVVGAISGEILLWLGETLEKRFVAKP